jgi:predicted outer membrane repeat protein
MEEKMKRFIFLLTIVMAASVSLAATITVTSTADSGAGSLRQAVIDASAGDTVDFNLTYPATITLTSGDININKNLTITGRANPRDIIIDGNANDYIFACRNGHTYNISGLTVSNGLHASAGGIYVASNDTRLNLSNCVVTACATTASNNGNGGGGIKFSAYTTCGGTVINCLFSGNSCPVSGTGLNADGGAIYIGHNNVSIKIKACSFENNSAGGDGGAVALSDNTPVELEDSTFFGNISVTGNAGAVYAVFGDTRDTDIINCTFIENATLNASGGGIGRGGAIFAQRGNCDLYNCTVVSNSASNVGGGFCGYGTASLNHFNLYSCIFGYNSAVNGDPEVRLSSDDGTINYCIYSGVPAGNNNVDAAPEVSQILADNGGPTKTLMIDNPGNCINAGDNPLSLTYDQRGPNYARTVGGVTDIGAVEWVPEPGLIGFISLGLLALIRKNR